MVNPIIKSFLQILIVERVLPEEVIFTGCEIAPLFF
jgi:hypothetical protein